MGPGMTKTRRHGRLPRRDIGERGLVDNVRTMTAQRLAPMRLTTPAAQFGKAVWTEGGEPDRRSMRAAIKERQLALLSGYAAT